MRPVYRRLRAKDKEEILERDAHICVYCGDEATVVDHILPWDWNHNDDPLNLVASCADCNHIAYDLIFDGLFEKAAFIREQRHLSKWTKRKFQRENVNVCISCKAYFRLCTNGATNFLCVRCAKEADMEPKERKKRQEERAELKRQYLLRFPEIEY